MGYHTISNDEITSFSVSHNHSGDFTLNFKTNDGHTNIELTLKDIISLANSAKDMAVDYISEYPLSESSESEDILWSLRNLFDYESLNNCYGDYDQIENLTKFLVEGHEYKFKEESSDEEYDEESSESSNEELLENEETE